MLASSQRVTRCLEGNTTVWRLLIAVINVSIECKWSPSAFDGTALEVFRRYYPKGRNWLLTPSASLPHERRFGSHAVVVYTPSGLMP